MRIGEAGSPGHRYATDDAETSTLGRQMGEGWFAGWTARTLDEDLASVQGEEARYASSRELTA